MSADSPSAGSGCPALIDVVDRGGAQLEYGLATCSKFNTSPPRGVPMLGEKICHKPGSTPANCWMDFYACRHASMPERAFNRSFTGAVDEKGEPQVALVLTDDSGRSFYCLQRDGQWIHSGEHDFPVGPKVGMGSM